MPSLTFVLPHWLYWAGLILLPLAAMYIVRHQRPGKKDGAVNLLTAYLFLVCSGFVGIHRFYLRNLWGAVYIPLFIAVLFLNIETRDVREVISNAKNQVSIAAFDLEEAQKDLKDGREGAQALVSKAEAALKAANLGVQEADESQAFWNLISTLMAGLIAVLLLIDAYLLPGMVRRVAAQEAGLDTGEGHITEVTPREHGEGGRGHPADRLHTPVTLVIDKLSGFSGEFVSYWSLIAVFVYYYEVVARYVFNSPTNWAHESMFLMFGMQYLLSGALALREDSHVRVDIIYLMFPDRAKAIINVLTSVFFFIFTLALLWTGITFATDSVAVWEVSFTEWAIQYWPVKISIAFGALLLLMQGFALLLKDVLYLTGKEA